MAFDFSQVLNDANASIKGGGAEGGGYKYPLVYPQVGTLQVKLLFNPKANVAMRVVNRHPYNETKVPCMKTYDQPCPICKVLEDIKNARGIELSKMRSTPRGIAIAQYVNSDYKIEKVSPGDIVLLMFPWTVYKDISTIIAQAQNNQEIESIIAMNEGFTLNIVRGIDNKYSTQINPFSKYKTCATDEEFVNLLNGFDSLNDQVVKTPITEDIQNQINDVVTELTNQYLVNRGPQFAQNPGQQQAMGLGQFGTQQPMNNGFNTQQAMNQIGQQFQQQAQQPMQTQQLPFGNAPQQPPMQQAPAPQMNQVMPGGQPASDKPPCYGQHGVNDMNQCLLCPVEIQCQQQPF